MEIYQKRIWFWRLLIAVAMTTVVMSLYLYVFPDQKMSFSLWSDASLVKKAMNMTYSVRPPARLHGSTRWLPLTTTDRIWRTALDGNDHKFAIATKSKGTKEITLNPEFREAALSNGGNLNKTKGPMLVLVVAYLRSGSSFTASLFTPIPEVFYVFEPLHMPSASFKQNIPLRYLSGITKRIYSKASLESIMFETMNYWMHCQLGRLDTASLMDIFHTAYTRTMKAFVACTKRHNMTSKSPNTAIIQCLSTPTEKCKDASLRIFKTIRLPMEIAAKLMRANGDKLKVIHLVRDPRAMFHSQFKTQLLSPVMFTSIIKSTCAQMERDGKITKQLLKNNRTAIKLVRYEDIANDPAIYTRELYRFSNQPITKQVLSYVSKQTSTNSTVNDNCAYCTSKSNSSRTASGWRKRIDGRLLSIVNRRCDAVLKMYGYRMMDIYDIRKPVNSVMTKEIPLSQSSH